MTWADEVSLPLLIIGLLLSPFVSPGMAWAGPALPPKPPTVAELIARIDDNIAEAMKEDQQLSHLEETIAQQMKAVRAEQLVLVSQQEQIEAAQKQRVAKIRDAEEELRKVRAAIAEYNKEVEKWNNRCAEEKVGRLTPDVYRRCQQDKIELQRSATQLATLRDRWRAEEAKWQDEFDKAEVVFKQLVAEWFARDAKLKEMATRLQQIRQRRAAIAENINRLQQLRARMVEAKCPAARTGTKEEVKLRCGNVQFDGADPNLPALEQICPNCVMPEEKPKEKPRT